MTTSLIIRPSNAPEITVLECDGPTKVPKVHLYPGYYKKFLSFEQFCQIREQRSPKQRSAQLIDFESAERISRIIENGQYQGFLSKRHCDEIQYRLELLFPTCTGGLLRTASNLQSA
jgi:hypothetical protein